MQATRQRSNGCIWWLTGGCALLVALIVGGAILGVRSLTDRFQHGGFSCLPSDFPTYPGSTFGGEQYTLNGPTPGNSCNMVFETNNSVANVQAFYASRLNGAGWQITSNNDLTGEIAFRNVKNARVTGTVVVGARGSHTEITVQYYRCDSCKQTPSPSG